MNILWQLDPVANKRLPETNENKKSWLRVSVTIFSIGFGDSIQSIRDHLIEEIKCHQNIHDLAEEK